MVIRAPPLYAWVFLLASAPCRGDRRQQDIVELLAASVAEENGTGVAFAVASSRQAANSTASQATKGVARQAASSSAARTGSSSARQAANSTASQATKGVAKQTANSSAARAATSSARSAANASAVVVADVTAKARVRQGRSARQRDQPSEHSGSSASRREESGDVLASNLTAATVQAHAALAHAVSALAEQQARKRQEVKNESESGSSAEGANKTADDGTTLPPEEKKLQEEESSMLGGGLSNLATAMSDPRKFLMGLDSIKMFAAGMRSAIEHGGEGKCLASGEFAGYGCGNDQDMPKICSCRHMFELCWLPDDPNLVVKKFPSQAALDEAKALLFGKCYTSYVLMAAIGVGGLVVLAVLASVLKGMFKKKSPS